MLACSEHAIPRLSLHPQELKVQSSNTNGPIPGEEKVANAIHTAADAVETAADHVRGSDIKSVMGDVRRIVKNNPGPALFVAAAFGFLIARTFSRN